MLHPDIKYQMYVSLQQERLQQARMTHMTEQTTSPKSGVRERLLLSSGELLISLGTSLKRQAQPKVCVAEAV